MKEFGIQVITVYPQLITRAFIEANIRVRTPTAKKIAGLFQDFQGPFSPFSRTKNYKSTADFYSNDMFRTMRRSVAQEK